MKIYTTGRIAKILKVAPRTVSEWIDCGMLPGYRIPSANRDRGLDRRVEHASLVQFARRHGLPMDSLGGGVVAVAFEEKMSKRLKAAVPDLIHFATPLEAALQIAICPPDAILLDAPIEGSAVLELIHLIRAVRSHQGLSLTPIWVICANGEHSPSNWIDEGADDVFPRPLDEMVLAARLATLVATSEFPTRQIKHTSQQKPRHRLKIKEVVA